MVKSQLVQKLCNMHPGVLRKDIEKILDVILIEISDALCRGENVEIRGFGTYKIKNRTSRMGRNPKTAEIVKIPNKKAVKWKMSKALFDRLNKNFTENELSDTN